MPIPTSTSKGRPAPLGPAADDLQDPVATAEAARALVLEAAGRLGQFVAVLKGQRRQRRALTAAVATLRQLQQFADAPAVPPGRVP
jgi:hypothetical protein